MTTKPKLGEGTVTIELDGEKVDLIPSWHAAKIISQQMGGLTTAGTNISFAGVDSMAVVIHAGAQLDHMTVDEVGELVYRNGARKLIPDLCKYVFRLSNGGKDPEPAKKSKTPGTEKA